MASAKIVKGPGELDLIYACLRSTKLVTIQLDGDPHTGEVSVWVQSATFESDSSGVDITFCDGRMDAGRTYKGTYDLSSRTGSVEVSRG